MQETELKTNFARELKSWKEVVEKFPTSSSTNFSETLIVCSLLVVSLNTAMEKTGYDV